MTKTIEVKNTFIPRYHHGSVWYFLENKQIYTLLNVAQWVHPSATPIWVAVHANGDNYAQPNNCPEDAVRGMTPFLGKYTTEVT